MVWYDFSFVETSLFRPRIYFVWVLRALALQCSICHYLRTELQMDGITDKQIMPSIIIDE